MKFEFQITNDTDPDPANTRYRVNLYVDQNGDGRHSEENELIPGITIESVKNGPNGTVTQRVTNGMLQADGDITYRVSRSLSCIMHFLLMLLQRMGRWQRR